MSNRDRITLDADKAEATMNIALRNRDIYKDHLSGATYGELGRKYALSRSRVFQIVLKEQMRVAEHEPRDEPEDAK